MPGARNLALTDRANISMISPVTKWFSRQDESNHRVARLERGAEYKTFFLLVFSVFSVPLW
jgi:hypothetical protein